MPASRISGSAPNPRAVSILSTMPNDARVELSETAPDHGDIGHVLGKRQANEIGMPGR